MSWVMSMIVCPAARSPLMMPWTARRLCGSSPVLGSSRNSTSGWCMIAPGWPLSQEWTDPQRREQILFAARSIETQASLIGFSQHLIAAATKP